MKFVILGSGTSAPRLDRHMSSLLVKAGKKNLLFDSGSGTIYQLLKAGIGLLDIDHIFYTHFHTDHTSDLPAIIWSNMYGVGSDSSSGRKKKSLNLYGSAGFRKYCKVLFNLHRFKPKFKINVFENKNNSFNINGTKVITKEMRYHHGNIGYRIEHENRIFVYSGDTGYCDEIIELSRNADLLVLECSEPNQRKFKEHLIPKECGQIATKAHVKKLVLTHFYPECDKYDIKSQAKETYKGPVILAKDLMELRV
jgi:ribonuclease BN (tRNA processing enzyme)